MLRKNPAIMCVATVVLCVAAIALAKAVRIELKPYPEEAPAEPGASGHAVINYVKGADKTIVEVNCRGLMAETEYKVYLEKDEEFYEIGSFTTRGNGSGNLHVEIETDASADVPVAVNNAETDTTVLLGPQE